jgi:hypothetical protein
MFVEIAMSHLALNRSSHNAWKVNQIECWHRCLANLHRELLLNDSAAGRNHFAHQRANGIGSVSLGDELVCAARKFDRDRLGRAEARRRSRRGNPADVDQRKFDRHARANLCVTRKQRKASDSFER